LSCARPTALIAGKTGARFNVEIDRIERHVHLPIVSLRRAA
jgi:hypothetical protein